MTALNLCEIDQLINKQTLARLRFPIHSRKRYLILHIFLEGLNGCFLQMDGVILNEGESDHWTLTEAITLEVDEIVEFVLVESAVIAMRRDLSIVSWRLGGFRADLVFVEGVGFE